MAVVPLIKIRFHFGRTGDYAAFYFHFSRAEGAAEQRRAGGGGFPQNLIDQKKNLVKRETNRQECRAASTFSP